MEAQSPRSRIGGSWASQLLATRRGAMTIAAVAAILAGILLYVFVQHYKSNSTPSAAVPAQIYVFEASKYIPQGTPAQTIAASGLLKKTLVPSRQAVPGAIADPSAITGEVAVTNIAAGQQITVADFSHANVSIGAYLTGTQRAIAVPLDAPHGLTSYLAPGNTVDLMVDSGGSTVMLAQHVSILENQGGNVVLRVTDKQALQVASASDGAKIWLVLRPPTGGQQSVRIGTRGTF